MPQTALDRMAELSPKQGSLRTDDSQVESVMEGLRRRTSGVCSTADLMASGGATLDELRESPIFRDIAFPLGIPGSTLLLHSGASGECLVHASYPEIDRRPFEEDTQTVLGSLLPAFAASLGALERLGNARQAVAVLLDALVDGALVFAAGARRVLARNAALAVLVASEPDLSGLESAISQSAIAAVRGKSLPRYSGAQDPAALSMGWRSLSGLAIDSAPSGCRLAASPRTKPFWSWFSVLLLRYPSLSSSCAGSASLAVRPK